MTAETTSTRGPEALDRVVIRFAGDSGDGMQLAGDRFTDVSAAFGNDLATLPNFPAEIRAPAGTIAGVSSFQVHISDHDILTPGDSPNVLVAMNPAALKANIKDMPPGATLLLNEDAFEQRNLDKAGYQANPIEDGSLSAYRIVQVPMTSITLESLEELLRARPPVVDVHAPDRSHRRMDQRALRLEADGARRQPRRVQGRVSLRRDRRALRPPVGGSAR